MCSRLVLNHLNQIRRGRPGCLGVVRRVSAGICGTIVERSYRKEDPAANRLAEYHEVTYARNSKVGGFALLDLHGWWENEKGTAHFNQSGNPELE